MFWYLFVRTQIRIKNIFPFSWSKCYKKKTPVTISRLFLSFELGNFKSFKSMVISSCSSWHMTICVYQRLLQNKFGVEIDIELYLILSFSNEESKKIRFTIVLFDQLWYSVIGELWKGNWNQNTWQLLLVTLPLVQSLACLLQPLQMSPVAASSALYS